MTFIPREIADADGGKISLETVHPFRNGNGGGAVHYQRNGETMKIGRYSHDTDTMGGQHWGFQFLDDGIGEYRFDAHSMQAMLQRIKDECMPELPARIRNAPKWYPKGEQLIVATERRANNRRAK